MFNLTQSLDISELACCGQRNEGGKTDIKTLCQRYDF